MTNFLSNGTGENERPESLRDMLRTHIVEQRKFNEKVERLHNVVLGDKGAEIDGLVHTVKKHGKYISLDKKMKLIATGLAGSATGVGFWDNIKHAFLKIFGG